MSEVSNQSIAVLEALFTAYNAGDAESLANLFAEDAVIYVYPATPAQTGRENIRLYYRELFSTYPQNHAHVLQRVVLGNYVIDHEEIQRTPDQEPFEVVVINEVRDGLIHRLELIRK